MDAWVVDENSKSFSDLAMKAVPLNSEVVKSALQELRTLLPDNPDPKEGKISTWRMEQIELTVELTAEGSVRLLGGVSAGFSGGINVTFKRNDGK